MRESLVICPRCRHHIQEQWVELTLSDPQSHILSTRESASKTAHLYSERWIELHVFAMACPNEKCKEVLVKVHRDQMLQVDSRVKSLSGRDSWFATPKKAAPRTVDESIFEPHKRDYLEAWWILEDSPRMSAVLSRKIIADLLKEHCGFDDHLLSERIANFKEDASHPSGLAENLDYSRKIGNLSAHTMLDDEGNIIEVGVEEAKWTLETVDELFDYFIVAPKRRAERKEAFDKKIGEGGSKPIAGSGE